MSFRQGHPVPEVGGESDDEPEARGFAAPLGPLHAAAAAAAAAAVTPLAGAALLLDLLASCSRLLAYIPLP